MKLIDQVLNNYEKKDSPPVPLCRVYLLRIEHTYYKLDVNMLKNIQEQIKQSEDKRAQTTTEGNEDSTTKPETTSEATVESETTDSTTPAANPAEEKPTHTPAPSVDDAELLNRLCTFIYTNGTDRIRTRAMLCHIFHHAKHDRWYEARDLMLISHLQETIQHSDIPTQVISCLYFLFFNAELIIYQ